MRKEEAIMEKRSIKVQSRTNKKLHLTVIPGHFATNHSHINFYIDMTSIKCNHSIAMEVAHTLADKYINDTPVDTIVCMDGAEMIGGFMAQELTKSGARALNQKEDICVITPEFNSNGQVIFRDNIQPMVWGKNVLLLIASATTGKTINRSLECIKYYGGTAQGIAAIFSAIDEMGGVKINSIFSTSDLPEYKTYNFKDCPDCNDKRKIDAIVNSYGYSKL